GIVITSEGCWLIPVWLGAGPHTGDPIIGELAQGRRHPGPRDPLLVRILRLLISPEGVKVYSENVRGAQINAWDLVGNVPPDARSLTRLLRREGTLRENLPFHERKRFSLGPVEPGLEPLVPFASFAWYFACPARAQISLYLG